MEYTTLKALQEAYQAGKIPARDGLPVLYLDHDSAYVTAHGECLFWEHPLDVLADALDLLGIPYEHV